MYSLKYGVLGERIILNPISQECSKFFVHATVAKRENADENGYDGTNAALPKIIERQAKGPVKNLCVLDSQLAGVALQEENYI